MMPVDDLVRLALDDLAPDRAEAAEAHILGCDDCARRLEELCAIGEGLRALVRSGGVELSISSEVADAMEREGLLRRRYRIPRDGAVACTVDPDDVYIETCLEADLAGVDRVDLIEPGGRRVEDVPFERERGQVRLLSRADDARQLPSITLVVRLVAVTADGDRPLGAYSFHHTAMKA